jgi:hypothetical protein
MGKDKESEFAIMTTDTLTGVLSRIKWRSPEEGNDYCISELSTGETVMGTAPDSDFIIGSSYSFQGTWKLGKEFRGQRSRDFHFTKYTRSEPHSRIGLTYYLEKFCPGIGPTLAGRIFDAFGQNAVVSLRTTPAEVAEAVQGLSLETAQEAAEELKKNVKFEETRIELSQLFQGKQFSRQLPNLVLKKWGVQAAARIKRDPFCLLVAGFQSCGFARCDRLYVEQGKKLHKLKRLMLFVWHQIRESMEGHTWHDAREIISKLRRDASVSDDGRDSMQSAEKRILRALELGVRSGWLSIKKTEKGIFVAEGQAAENEEIIARSILNLVMETKKPDPMDVLVQDTELKRLIAEEDRQRVEEERQRADQWSKLSPLSAEEKAAIGRATGICQFCSRELTHPESKLRGYGPTCAAKHCLPWDGSTSGSELDSNDGVPQSILNSVGAD